MIVPRITSAIEDSHEATLRARTRLRKEGLFRRYGRLARRAGLDRVWLVLSFDCDTPEDAAAAAQVHRRLGELGVQPAYAVPGFLLREAADVYGAIAATGAEFLNHGNRMHTAREEASARWVSTFFYDQQLREVLVEDIAGGHATVREVLGRPPQGFRTPHFGTFQSSEQLTWLHGCLRGLGYRYSSSTVPLWGFRHGPAFSRFGCVELPVTGAHDAPLSILDTWGCFAAPDRLRTPADFERQAAAVAEAYARAGAGVINVYGDPSHIDGREEFFRAVERWLGVAQPTSYAGLLERIR